MKNLVFILALGTLGLALPVQAQVGAGVNVQYGLDFQEPQIGGELHLPLASVLEGLTFVPNAKVYLTDEPSIVVFSGNFHWAPTVSSGSTFRPYVGAGIAAVRFSEDDRDFTETGLNLLGGINFRAERFVPFVQIELRTGDAGDTALGGGVRFLL